MLLKTNKTQFYNLLKDKTDIELPKMREIEFFKRKNYFHFITLNYEISLLVCAGFPRIVIREYDSDKGFFFHPTITLSVDELINRGMIKVT